MSLNLAKSVESHYQILVILSLNTSIWIHFLNRHFIVYTTILAYPLVTAEVPQVGSHSSKKCAHLLPDSYRDMIHAVEALEDFSMHQKHGGISS